VYCIDDTYKLPFKPWHPCHAILLSFPSIFHALLLVTRLVALASCASSSTADLSSPASGHSPAAAAGGADAAFAVWLRAAAVAAVDAGPGDCDIHMAEMRKPCNSNHKRLGQSPSSRPNKSMISLHPLHKVFLMSHHTAPGAVGRHFGRYNSASACVVNDVLPRSVGCNCVQQQQPSLL